MLDKSRTPWGLTWVGSELETPLSLLEEGAVRPGRTAQEHTSPYITQHGPGSVNLQLPWFPIQFALFLFYDSVLGLSLALMQGSKANALPLSDNHSPLFTLELGFSCLSLLTSWGYRSTSPGWGCFQEGQQALLTLHLEDKRPWIPSSL